MHRDMLFVESKHVRHRGARVARRLRADPQFSALGGDAHGGIHRLHRGMREKRCFVRGVDRAGGFLERLLRPAVEAYRHAVIVVHGVADVLHHRHGGDRTRVPCGRRCGRRR